MAPTNPAPLPPQVSAVEFANALQEIRAALGDEFVFVSEENRCSYPDTFAIGDSLEHEPSAAVAPKSLEQIQAVLKIANPRRIPL